MKNLISDRAIIEEGAVFGENTVVAPNAFIGNEVRIGKNCEIMNNAYITGNTFIGDNCKVFPGAVIGTVTQAKNYSGEKSGVVIGNNNTIREFVTINSTEGNKSDYTTIGNNNLIMAYSHVAHHCIIHDNIIMSNGATLAGHVEVFSNAILGGLSAVHQFVRIGSYSIIGGKAKVIKDIIPYIKVDGNPSKVIGLNSIAFSRNGFSEQKINNIKDIFKILFRKGYNVSQAMDEMKNDDNDESREIIEFITGSGRGILFKRFCKNI